MKYIYKGHITRKRFSQNFIHNRNVIKDIIAAINPQFDQAMVEIGPGLGALTENIAQNVSTITVIEIDHNLALRLNNKFIKKYNINILQKDVLIVDFNYIAAMHKKPLRVFGNLPYNISTKILLHLFKYTNSIYDMHFMLQKEVANRLLACPNSKVYGRISIIAQYYCNIIPLIEVPSSSFRPVPKVDSMFIRLVPYINLPYQVKDIKKLLLVTKIAFNQRRKTIRNSFINIFSTKQIIEQGIDVNLRAENLNIKQYCSLANLL